VSAWWVNVCPCISFSNPPIKICRNKRPKIAEPKKKNRKRNRNIDVDATNEELMAADALPFFEAMQWDQGDSALANITQTGFI
jgi:hypothetical protein